VTLAASAAPPDSATKTLALETTARELAENQRTLERAPGSQTRFVEASQVAQAVEYAQWHLAATPAGDSTLPRAAEWFLDNYYLIRRVARQIDHVVRDTELRRDSLGRPTLLVRPDGTNVSVATELANPWVEVVDRYYAHAARNPAAARALLADPALARTLGTRVPGAGDDGGDPVGGTGWLVIEVRDARYRVTSRRGSDGRWRIAAVERELAGVPSVR